LRRWIKSIWNQLATREKVRRHYFNIVLPYLFVYRIDELTV
jgi:hypothetical protein